MLQQAVSTDKSEMHTELLRSAIAELVRPYATNDAQVESYLTDVEQMGRLQDTFGLAYKDIPHKFNPANVADDFVAWRSIVVCNPCRDPSTLRWAW